MKFIIGLTIILIGLCTFNCIAKPTTEVEVTAHASKNDKTSSAAVALTDETESDDMLMEPNEYSHVSVIKSEGKQIFPVTTTTEYDESPVDVTGGDDSHSQAAQNFYPQFFRNSPSPPPLGHSRPYFATAGSAESPTKFLAARSFDQSILGSGDFGVMHGGTFYSDDEAPYHQQEDNSGYNNFYGGSENVGGNSETGHGRSQSSDSYIHKFTYPEEQFANFRDFADINTPSDSAYSQFVVVYANKNSTTATYHPNPKNIFEQLQLLDKEKELEDKMKKTNVLSKTKTKLSNTKLEKKYKKKSGPKDQDYEPLLALS